MIDQERVKFDLCPVYRVRCEYVSVARAAAEIANRYDDAMKRIHDLTAELEHLRREVNRG